MKRYKLLILIIILFNIIILTRISFLMLNNKYEDKYNSLTNKLYELGNPPRGRILDTNGKVLVDNKGIKVLVYNKLSGNSVKEEIRISKILGNLIDIDINTLSDKDLYNYFYLDNKELVDNRIDRNVLNDFNNRKIDIEEFNTYKLSLISKDEINSLDKDSVMIYKLMNKGYYYEDKVLFKDFNDDLLVKLSELNLTGIRVDMSYERVFNYDTCLNQLFGEVGFIQKEKIDYYLDNNYQLSDIVGISYLEEEYESYLRGIKAKYKLINNELIKVSDEVKGNDLVLGIDIDIQLKIEDLLKKQILNAKKISSSKYYDGSYIVLSDSDTGLIKSLVGIKFKDGKFISDSVGVITNTFTVGSVVKGASQFVAYTEGILDEDTKILDGCVKLKNQLPKCSHKSLGYLNDINAIAYSSNYFQFLNAIKVTGDKYTTNMVFNPDKAYFDSYREYFKLFGLGDYTGIDVGKESSGIVGTKYSGDLLLNYVIGQYDTYSVLQLNQYISTISNNGIRYKLRLGDYVIDSNSNKLNINNKEVLNYVDNKYLNRIRKSMNAAVKYGTAVNYFDPKLGGGKTGTSETFYNGKNTTTKSFVGFYNINNTNYAVSIISPNIAYQNSVNNYVYPINSRLSREITHILFEN